MPSYDGQNQNTVGGGPQFAQTFASGNAAGPSAGMRAGPNLGAGQLSCCKYAFLHTLAMYVWMPGFV